MMVSNPHTVKANILKNSRNTYREIIFNFEIPLGPPRKADYLLVPAVSPSVSWARRTLTRTLAG